MKHVLLAVQYGWEVTRMSDFVIRKDDQIIRATDSSRVKWIQCHPDASTPAWGDVDWELEIDGEIVDHVKMFDLFKVDEPQYDEPDQYPVFGDES